MTTKEQYKIMINHAKNDGFGKMEDKERAEFLVSDMNFEDNNEELSNLFNAASAAEQK